MGHNNTKGNRKFIKGRYTANAAKGERLVSSEFQLTFAGHEDISVLVRTSQIPEMTREDVEDYGPNGVKFNQHGPIRKLRGNPGPVRGDYRRRYSSVH
ncbi:hypothetical protein NIZ20_23510 (plasmid) [Escherichia albertii]|nr:hypothetical protein NIZ20_23510 [Escherichia albertii]